MSKTDLMEWARSNREQVHLRMVRGIRLSDATGLSPGGILHDIRVDELAMWDALLARLAPEPAPKPLPCWCPYCNQPHSPNLRADSPVVAGQQPCKCPNTANDCSIAMGCQLGSSWHCRRTAETKVAK